MVSDERAEGGRELPTASVLVFEGGAGLPMAPLGWIRVVSGVVLLHQVGAEVPEGLEAQRGGWDPRPTRRVLWCADAHAGAATSTVDEVEDGLREEGLPLQARRPQSAWTVTQRSLSLATVVLVVRRFESAPKENSGRADGVPTEAPGSWNRGVSARKVGARSAKGWPWVWCLLEDGGAGG